MTIRKDILLNPCGDVAIENGDLVLVDGQGQIRQSWVIHMRTLQGEIVTDINKGMPWFQKILEKHSDMTEVEQYFIKGSLEVSGVVRVDGVEIEVVSVETRTYSITCYVAIESDEGEESAVFNYEGSLPVGSCNNTTSSNYPLTFDNLKIWFDAQDLGTITQRQAPAYLRLENKAGTGYAIGMGKDADDIPVLVGVSSLNNKRAIYFNNTQANGNEQRLNIYDTRAIRGGDNDLTIFFVGKWELDPSAVTRGLIGLRGQNDAGTSEECVFLKYGIPEAGSNPEMTMDSDTDLVGNERAIGASAVPGFYNPFYVTAILKNGSTAEFYFDNVSAGGFGTLTPRKLDGDGFIGCGIGSDCKTPSGFNYLYFGEVLVFEGELTAEEIGNVNSWLADKWGF